MTRKLFGHISLSWVSAVLALIFPILTATYAFRPQSVSHLRAIGSSPSSALLVLRILSEVGSVMLAATIAAAFNTLQIILVARNNPPRGLGFLDYLVLQEGSGFSSLVSIVVWRGKVGIVTRLYSVVRLIAIALVPVLNIVVMSNVETRATFYRVETTPVYGFGIGTFNASLARLWAPATDLLYSTGFNEFVSDTTRTVDITEGSNRENCARRNHARIGSDCLTTLFGAQNWTYNTETECGVYGSELFPFALCLRNGADGLVQAHLTLCSLTLNFDKCFNSTAWRDGDGWSTSVRTSYRRATVAYGRFNGTILSHTFSNIPTIDASINATELLQAFDIILGADSSNTTLISPFAVFGSRMPAPPYFIWWYFHGIDALPRNDAAGNARAVAGLQSLLTLTIYHCQAKDFVDLERGLGFDNSTAIGSAILSVFPTTEPDTAILPAVLRYNIVVGRRSLIAYVVLSGVSWLLCAAILLAGSVSPVVRKAKDTTAFPTLDFCTKCEVRDDIGAEVSKEQLSGLDILTTKERTIAIAKMKVRLLQALYKAWSWHRS
ncbi:hypothetical protein F5882DRAFT_488495 [Hyaloscypha sp. PMI_1271]|nr:hypothetical protein F5882DRAFT_488495 [Hyaloscypha sp. PMI_1271]